MTDDDFILEEESASSSRRPFLIAAATLFTIFIAAAACSLIFLFQNRTASNPQATAIAATNAVILITNEAVTAAIDATNVALSLPTDTPEATATQTATATAIPDTATPTETPVVETAKDTPTPNTSGTSVAEPTGDATDSPGNDGAENGTATPIPASTTTSPGKDDVLPQTGLETWGILGIGLLFVAILVAARRLRHT